MNPALNSENKERDAFGINSDVRTKDRNYHIQTSYEQDSNNIISSVFDGGRLIEKNIQTVGTGLTSQEIKKRVETYHREVSSQIETLFVIADKIKAVEHSLSHNRMGLVFLQKNYLNEAEEQFKLAIEGDKNQPEFYLNLGNVYFAQQVYAKAAEQYTIGIEKGPQYADIYNKLGLVLGIQGKYRLAIEKFREAVQINKKYHEAYFNLGLALLESTERDLRDSQLPAPSERLSEAAKRFRKAMQLSKIYNRDHMKQGLRFIEEKNSAKAYKEFLLARGDVQLKRAHSYENEFYLQFLFGGHKEEAMLVNDFIIQIKELIKKYPEFADLRNNLGIAYLIQGRNLLYQAVEEFQRALKINPKFQKAKKNLRLVENDGRGFLILLRALLK